MPQSGIIIGQGTVCIFGAGVQVSMAILYYYNIIIIIIIFFFFFFCPLTVSAVVEIP